MIPLALASDTAQKRFKVLTFMLVFLCTANHIITFPLDKVAVVLLMGAAIYFHYKEPFINQAQLMIAGLLILIPILSCIANVSFAGIIFFPFLGFLSSVYFSNRPELTFGVLYYAIFVHIVLGILFVILANMGYPNDYVWSLGEKGFASLYCGRGFTATVQTFGTLCITWLIIFSMRRRLFGPAKGDWFLFSVVIVGLITTLNRSSLIFLVVILFLEFRKIFWVVFAMIVAVVIRYWEVIFFFLTDKTSLDARSELLEGFYLSYVQSDSPLVYIFGRGINQYSPEVLAKVKWDYRAVIENGYAMILHTYGIIGMLFYICLAGFGVFTFFRARLYSKGVILFFFLFFTPYFTHEFYSETFYLFLGVMLCYYNLQKKQGSTTPISS
jgi:hypothetical protein